MKQAWKNTVLEKWRRYEAGQRRTTKYTQQLFTKPPSPQKTEILFFREDNW